MARSSLNQLLITGTNYEHPFPMTPRADVSRTSVDCRPFSRESFWDDLSSEETHSAGDEFLPL